MAFVNHFFVATGLSFMLAIAGEMHYSILNLQKLKLSQTVKVVLAIVIESAIWTIVQLAPPFKVTYAKSGLYCFGTSWTSWPAIVNLIFFPAAAVFFAFVYLRIYVKLGLLLRQRTTRLDGVKSTMTQGAQLSSSISGSSAINPENKTRSSFALSGPLLLDALKIKKTKPGAESAAVREKRIQRRFVLRGTLALFNSCCYYVPLWIACLHSYRTGLRSSLEVDKIIVVLGCLSGLCDPIIAAAQDTRFRKAVKDVVARHRHQTASHHDHSVTAQVERSADWVND
ncbi:hypothetical protein BCR44DRAFT_330373 [Catenaria anguillulae PL171]|uniref:G-protein coupled receptors family 1 profile domain-containing protein n=1 Tax=Catenaria anguillulae PL171 TaxID=765915 RepID=A0A1Y2HMZ6_9FUNG|nr:hypothetical protein BCR44DRAFT_330373 [Catenaria anguillulae PL171]